MGRRGPPPLPPNVVAMRGTDRSVRPRDYAVDPLGGEVERPTYLKGRARKVFDRLADKFVRRGQQVVGVEDMLAVYASELARFEDDARRGVRWTASQLNALKGLAVQFYDTPASQIQIGGKPDSPNAFGRNGPNGREREQ